MSSGLPTWPSDLQEHEGPLATHKLQSESKTHLLISTSLVCPRSFGMLGPALPKVSVSHCKPLCVFLFNDAPNQFTALRSLHFQNVMYPLLETPPFRVIQHTPSKLHTLRIHLKWCCYTRSHVVNDKWIFRSSPCHQTFPSAFFHLQMTSPAHQPKFENSCINTDPFINHESS